MTDQPPPIPDDAAGIVEASRDKVRVVFTPSGLQGTVVAGSTVLETARELGADLDTVCGGRGLCGRCQVTLPTGEYPKWAMSVAPDHFPPPDSVELDYRGARPLVEGRRLGCRVRLLGDAVVDVPAESQIHKQVVRKEFNIEGLVVHPPVSLHYLTLNDNEDGDSITSLVTRALADDWNIIDPGFDFGVLASLHEAAADPSRGLTVAVRYRAVDPAATRAGPTVVGAWPGFIDRIAGAAIDIGSTTVAGHLCALGTGEFLSTAGRMNPQIRFGEDLMSRVSYVMMNPGGEVELTGAIRQAVQELLDELLEAADLDWSRLVEVVLVGNPIMQHLALGIDPTPLGQAPFPLATDGSVTVHGERLGFRPGPTVYFGPCIAGHVGADTAAAILAEKPHRRAELQLLVDVGTNAEIVLGNQDGLLAASSPTGPAFEGAQISAGQRATAGAIERVRIDRNTLEPRFKVIGSEFWSDEPGFTDEADITGICGSGIIEVISEMFLSGIIDSQGVIGAAAAGRSSRVVPDERTFKYLLAKDDIFITQADVRAVQLAKAALRAGIDLLLERAGLSTVDQIRLAGAFGAHIDPLHAMVLGLIPDCPLDAVAAVGNAAGSGAVRSLLSTEERAEMEAVVASVIKIETATEPRFQELFVAALAFPHMNAPSDNLAAAVDLPTTSAATKDNPRRRRRRPGSR
ncbi:MAG: ASKHA domain-containing protein [Acidimicrobiia bacterium]|nr:ASKHA domain-containing protein [Acidimicrobiia bacterium]